MNRCCKLLLPAAVVVLMAGGATVEAAKGAKKGVEHKVHGTVIGLQQGKQGVLITISTHHHRKAAAAKMPGAPMVQNTSHHTFQVTQGTQVVMLRGTTQVPANAAALHNGAQVVIWATGHHADRIEVVSHKVKPKKAVQ
jgi:hypothetical protein